MTKFIKRNNIKKINLNKYLKSGTTIYIGYSII